MGPCRDRRRRGVGRRRAVAVVVVRVRTGVGHGDRVERRQNPLPERGALLGSQPFDRGEDARLIARRRLDGDAGVAECHHAHDDARRLVLHERLRRGLCGVHTGRLEVVGRHAARDVEGEDDGPLLAREVDHALRPGHRDGHDRDARRRRSAAEPARQAAGPGPAGRVSPGRRGPPPVAVAAPRAPGSRAARAGIEREEQEHRRPDEGHRPTAGAAVAAWPSGRSPGRGPRRSTASPHRRRPA